MKRPDKIIYTGIGLIVGSFFVGIIVSDICPSLLTLTTLIFIAGILVASCGIVQIFRKAAKKRNETITPCQTEENSYRNLKVGYCDCCGKRFVYPASKHTHPASSDPYSENYCASCKKAIEHTAKNQHTVCSMCGSDLLLKDPFQEDVYVIDGASVCRNCFLNFLSKYGNTNSHDGKETASAIENTVKLLRKRIIDEIIEEPAAKYELSALFWQDAANCFPGYRTWDLAVFNLDLKTGKLFVELSTYQDNPYGACYRDFCPVSAAEFNQIAKKYDMTTKKYDIITKKYYDMSLELQAFNSDDDWAKLFDDDLKAVVASVCATLQKRAECHNDQARLAISADFADLSPNMDISEITIELDLRYGSDSIKVLNEGGKYKAVYEGESKMLPDDKKYKRYLRELSSAESVWLEKQLATTINNPDNSTWQSLPGGDIMDVVIKQSRANDVCLRGIKPIKKYMHLQSNLEKLAEYGSFQVHSVK